MFRTKTVTIHILKTLQWQPRIDFETASLNKNKY